MFLSTVGQHCALPTLDTPAWSFHMTDDHHSETVTRRRMLQASGAAALAIGLAGCDDLPGTGTTDEGEPDDGTPTDRPTTDERTPTPNGGETLPVLDVTSTGITQQKASALAAELGLDGEFEVDEYGVLQYIDEDEYMSVPTADTDPTPGAFDDWNGENCHGGEERESAPEGESRSRDDQRESRDGAPRSRCEREVADTSERGREE